MKILNKFKRGLAALLSLSVAASAVFVFHFPLLKAHADYPDIVEHDDHDGWMEFTLDENGNPPSGGGNYYLGDSVELDEAWKPAAGTVLCLNNSTISSKDGDYAILVESGSFTLCDCDSGTITSCVGVKVESGGEFNLCSGAIISGHKITNGNGGGVYVANGGVFNMYDGMISENLIKNGGNGAGVYVAAGGEFKMSGGEIYHNTISSNGDGGGVYNEGTFELSSGSATISSNTIGNDGNGAGVCNKNIFIMSDGLISENTAIYGDNTNNGGGVYNDGTFEMTGGEISGNEADDNGGGVYNKGTFTMNNSEISGNKTYAGAGGGVYVEKSSTMTVGGTAIIYDNDTDRIANNVYLATGAVINIDKFDVPNCNEEMIYVTAQAIEEAAEGTTIDNVPISGKNDENYRLFFGSDNREYYVGYGADNKLMLTTTDTDSDSYKETVEPINPGSSGSGDSSNSSDSGSTGDSGDSGNTEDTKHTHALCGDTSCTTHEPDTEWTEWNKNNELPKDKANYCLTVDVTLTDDSWKPADGARLCLNGHTITAKGNFPVITVTEDFDFALCDCKGTGTVTHESSKTGIGVTVKDKGEFTINSGKITDNEYGVYVEVGGEISGSTENVTGNTTNIYHETTTTPSTHTPHNNGEDWTEWTETTKLPDTAGHYYLSDNVTLTGTWEPKGNTYLCLNSYSIKMNGALSAISVTTGNNLTLCDCKDKGSVTHINGATGKGVKITGGSFTMNSGTITGNEYGVFVSGGTITVGGTAKIISNTDGNVYLSTDKTITVDGSLTIGANIGVTIEADPKNGDVAVTGTNNKNVTGYFTSDQNYYKADGENHVVMFSTTKPTEPDPPVTTTHNTHPICGDINCKARHNAPANTDGSWTAWESTTTLPSAPGYYYLKYNVTLTDTWNPTGDTYLCLNGKNITLANRNIGNVIAIGENDSLTLCDCAMYASGNKTASLATATTTATVNDIIADFGTIGGSSASGVKNDGEFYMYGGVITGNGASGVRNSSDFVMNGGVIIGNTATNGGGMYNSGTFTMYGGVIAGNDATNGGGVYNSGTALIEGRIFKNTADSHGGGVYQNGKFTVNNGAYIMLNTVNGKKNNVYLPSGKLITVGTGLSDNVGVTLEKTPTSTGSVKFTEASSSVSNTALNKIKSDSSSFTTKITTSSGKKTLSLVRTSDDDDDDTTHDWRIKSTLVSSSQVPSADRTAIINMLKTMPDWVIGAYYDVILYDDDVEVDEATSLLSVKLTVPASIRAQGRVFKVVRVHDGAATLLDDTDSEPNTVTVKSKLFSTYAIIYSVSGSSGGSSGSGSNGGYQNPAMGVENDIPLAGLACGFTALALAAPGKKLEK